MARAERKVVSENVRMKLETLIDANILILRQGVVLLDEISDADYSRTIEPLFGFGLGYHFRHLLDSYDCFFRGRADGQIDYDRRARDVRVALDREYARTRIESVIAALTDLPAGEMDRAIDVRQDSHFHARSSIPRELQFLLSHTVHHYALMAMMARMLGVEIDDHFGVAPSTLEYWQSGTGPGD